MKKIILLLLIFISVPFIITSKQGTYPIDTQIAFENDKNTRNSEWEYIKNRLFNGESEYVFKIQGPILIALGNATKKDSLAMEKTMSELKKILPNKTIDYFKNYMKVDLLTDMSNKQGYSNGRIEKIKRIKLYSSVIHFVFNETPPFFRKLYNSSILDDGTTITRERRYHKKRGEKFLRSSPETIHFDISKDISQEKRLQYIQYEFFRWLCSINSDDVYFLKYIKSGIFNSPEYLPEYGKLNSLDTFLLQKLYSDDFIEEFKSYLFKNYPWRYAQSFINKKKAKLYAYIIVSALGLILFLLSFPLVKKVKFKHLYLNYLFVFLLLNINLMYLTHVFSYVIQLNSIVTWQDNFIAGYIIVSGVSIVMSFVLWGLEKLFIRKKYQFRYQISLQFLFTLITLNLFPIFILIVKRNSTNNLDVTPILLLFFGLSIIRCSYIYLNHYSESLIKQKEVELSQLKELQAATELNSLHAKINPHFLYNALNSIASLAAINANKTEEMALSLSDLFKYSINRKGEKMSTIKEEVEMVENYLKIEKIRFEDRLEFSVDVESSLLETSIPRFILQPLIENAVKHGISKIEDKGSINLTIIKNNNDLIISVSDNGPNFPDGLLSGHGLQSVYDLLRLSYAEQATMNWENLPKKKITISIRSNS